jgi:predicted DNA-binding mobile mystery protein A
MKATFTGTRGRQRLDSILSRLREVLLAPNTPIPRIAAIRQSLGMTLPQLAKRMNVHLQVVERLEREEAKPQGDVDMAALRKAADAMGCTLVYALVPKTSEGMEGFLRETAQDRATKLMADSPATVQRYTRQQRSEIETVAAALIEASRVWEG